DLVSPKKSRRGGGRSDRTRAANAALPRLDADSLRPKTSRQVDVEGNHGGREARVDHRGGERWLVRRPPADRVLVRPGRVGGRRAKPAPELAGAGGTPVRLLLEACGQQLVETRRRRGGLPEQTRIERLAQ